jgi:hypothetical protein
MRKFPAYILFLMVVSIVSFSTWQLFQGNLAAAFSSLPLLLVTYLFLKLNRKNHH